VFDPRQRNAPRPPGPVIRGMSMARLTRRPSLKPWTRSR
jgi:hypothetical protein